MQILLEREEVHIMRIIVTDAGRYWNHESPILEKYAECVLVVCLNGKRLQTNINVWLVHISRMKKIQRIEVLLVPNIRH